MLSVLWGGFACFVLAALHMVLKRTPLLVRFHPLWWIRKRAATTAKEAKEAARRAARDAKAAKRSGQTGKAYGEAAATLAAGVAGVAAGMAGDDATAAGTADVGAAEEYLGTPAHAGVSADGIPDVEVGEYMKRDSRGDEEL